MNTKSNSVPVTFDCQLTGLGWMKFEFKLGSQDYGCRASWMTPTALADLIQAVNDLHEGSARTESQMAQEPGSYRWIFTKEDEQMHLRVLLFDIMWSKEPDEEGVVVFGGRCQFEDFQRAFVLSLERLLEKWGVDGFKEKWHSDFPMEKYETLRGYAGL